MEKIFRQCLWRNFGAAIDMLRNAIVACPDELWQNDKKFFYLAYHTIIFLDYYLTYPVKKFRPLLDYTIRDVDHLPVEAVDDVIPNRVYSKEEFSVSLSSIREKCGALIKQSSEETLKDRWIKDEEVDIHGLCPSVVLNYSVLEILFYNFRHVQHHVGQLNLLLRQTANIASNWVSQAD
jgi:hypothetical protein